VTSSRIQAQSTILGQSRQPLHSVMVEFGSEDRIILERLKTLGFSPTSVWDVGASNGAWTRLVGSAIFPDACFQMFEPLADLSSHYQEGLQDLLVSPVNCILHQFALGEQSGEATIGFNTDLASSSLLVEQKSEYFPEAKAIQVMSIDDAVRSFQLPKPQLLKMDTQGFELEILKGGVQTLESLEVILVEGWLTRAYGPKTPLLMEIANWLAQYDFFLFDFGGTYRSESGVLVAQDAFFVKGSSKTLQSDVGERRFNQISESVADPADLQQVQAALEQVKAELRQSETRLQASQNEVEAMKSSKFWKLRSAWFNVKTSLGMS
jgi:FkbM family methyltransferase